MNEQRRPTAMLVADVVFCQPGMSGYGPELTIGDLNRWSALGGKADQIRGLRHPKGLATRG
jgi:hypothetical protein